MRSKSLERAIQTKWVIVTGGPNSGKSHLLDHLAHLGEITIPEAARVYINNELSKGRTLAEIRAFEDGFQRTIFDLKLRTEAHFAQKFGTRKRLWWERGVHEDSIAYSLAQGLDGKDSWSKENDLLIINYHPPKYRYAHVFWLDQIPYAKDYARTEDEAKAKLIHKLIGMVYTMSGYNPIRVPVLPIEERANFVLNHVRGNQRYRHVLTP